MASLTLLKADEAGATLPIPAGTHVYSEGIDWSNLERPAVLTPLLPHAVAVIGDCGAADQVIVDHLTSAEPFTGRLPFDLPRSRAAVLASREDVPFDTHDPLYRSGHGLRQVSQHASDSHAGESAEHRDSRAGANSSSAATVRPAVCDALEMRFERVRRCRASCSRPPNIGSLVAEERRFGPGRAALHGQPGGDERCQGDRSCDDDERGPVGESTTRLRSVLLEHGPQGYPSGTESRFTSAALM